ncbi:RNA methyltransferase tRNA(m5U54)methyltransferase [Bachmanniomyces sp. S44760]|nr:RNA methyltransferase tRNA(m5U54)methyltransferase [Bachmanniomyces sp. S44760]
MAQNVGIEGLDASAADSTVSYDEKTYTIISEGLAQILIPSGGAKNDQSKAEDSKGNQSQAVFYNPIQQFNRDLTVLVIRAFSDDLSAIRKARHERRLNGIASKQSKGQKRKRENLDETNSHAADNEESPGTKGTELDIDAASSSRLDDRLIEENEHGVAQPFDRGETTQDVSNTVDHVGAERSVDVPGAPKGPRGAVPRDVSPRATCNILDALSATGLRAIRYAKEIPEVSITANDLSKAATESIKLNVQHNNVADRVRSITGDAISHMYRAASESNARRYDVIDLDPYGTAAPFLDAAVRAFRDGGGLLCVTSTDSGVFASVGYPEKTFSQYGGLPLKGPQSHEAGLRLLLNAIASSAARYSLAIEPLVSLSVDYYIRVFVRIKHSPAEVKFLGSKTMLVYNCDSGCGAWSTQHLAHTRGHMSRKNELLYRFSLAQGPSAAPSCQHCGFKTHVSGPMWAGPLHNPYFIQRILDDLPTLDQTTYGTVPRMEGMLSIALRETLVDSTAIDSLKPEALGNENSTGVLRLDPASPDHHPFFTIPSTLAKILHCIAPSDAQFRGALIGLGYRVTRSHCKPGSIRTDAPWAVIWEVMREWVRQKAPIKADAIQKGSAGWGIMQKDRSKAKILDLKNSLDKVKEALDVDPQSAKTELESILYRLEKGDAAPTEESKGDGAPDPLHTNGTGDPHAPMKTSHLKVVFDEKLGRESEGKKLLRYQMNPRANWGPMSRAKGGDTT